MLEFMPALDGMIEYLGKVTDKPQASSTSVTVESEDLSPLPPYQSASPLLSPYSSLPAPSADSMAAIETAEREAERAMHLQGLIKSTDTAALASLFARYPDAHRYAR